MESKSLQLVKRSQNENCKFSLLIPTWNNLPYLKLCIRSIRENSALNHQIIVIVNEGADGTVDWLISQPDIDYVFSEKNLGICYGLNASRPLIETDYVVYVNDDMYMLPDWDKVLFDEIRGLNHKEFLLSATMIEPVDTKNPCTIVANFGDSPETFQERELLDTFRDFKKSDWSGSTWPPVVIPTVIWDLVGGMSVEFSPGMYSDPDFSMKLWQVGVRYFKGVSASRVYHFGSKSTKRIKKNQGRNKFLHKYGITPHSFDRNYLRRGQPFTGPLAEPVNSFFEKSINKMKLVWRVIADK